MFWSAIQSPERKRTRSGRSAASSETTAARCYGRGGSLSAQQRTSWGVLSKTDEKPQRATTGRAFAGMMSSPARGGKRRKLTSTVSFVATGGCSTRLWISWKKRAGVYWWYGLDLWEAVPEGAHCHPIPISRTRAHYERRERPSSFPPPWPLDLFGLDKDHPFEHAWKARAHTSRSPTMTVRMARRSYTTRSSRSSVRGVPATMDAVIRVASDLRSNPPSSIRLDEVCRLFGFIHRSHARQYLHNIVLDCQQYRVWCRSIYGCTVWWLSFSAVDYIYTLYVERGYIGPSRVPGSWEGAGTFFFVVNTFAFVYFFHSLALVFQRSPTRNKESTRFTLTVKESKPFLCLHMCRWSPRSPLESKIGEIHWRKS